MNNNRGRQTLRGYDSFEVRLGDLMRGERATLGKSLFDVQRFLRIDASCIAAIEDSNLSPFMTPSFIPGYVRSYAQYLSLDPDECFARFCEESGFSGVHTDLQPNSFANKSPLPTQVPGYSMQVDPIAQPRFPLSPPSISYLGSLSPSSLVSVIILVFLLSGLGYGGWVVLQEVQRVQFISINQPPNVVSDLANLPNKSTLSTNNADDLNSEEQLQTSSLDQLYRTTEFKVSQTPSANVAISTIKPGSFGAYIEPQTPTIQLPIQDPDTPRVIIESPPPVYVVAIKPSWIRVYLEDGSVLFQKILNAGERYLIPGDVDVPLLRAGNATAVFVMVGNNTYGPVGKESSNVVSGLLLDVENITDNLALVKDIFADPLEPPLDGLNPVAHASGTN